MLLPFFPLRRQQTRVVPEMLNEVFHNQSALSYDCGLGGSSRLDAYDGGFAQCVNFLEFWRAELCFLVAVEDLEFVGEVEFFEEPEDALGAGLFEPGECVSGLFGLHSGEG